MIDNPFVNLLIAVLIGVYLWSQATEPETQRQLAAWLRRVLRREAA